MEKFSLEKERTDELSMNNYVISKIVNEIEEAKICMQNKLIWRKVESKESEDDSLDEKDVN